MDQKPVGGEFLRNRVPSTWNPNPEAEQKISEIVFLVHGPETGWRTGEFGSGVARRRDPTSCSCGVVVTALILRGDHAELYRNLR